MKLTPEQRYTNLLFTNAHSQKGHTWKALQYLSPYSGSKVPSLSSPSYLQNGKAALGTILSLAMTCGGWIDFLIVSSSSEPKSTLPIGKLSRYWWAGLSRLRRSRDMYSYLNKQWYHCREWHDFRLKVILQCGWELSKTTLFFKILWHVFLFKIWRFETPRNLF